MIRRFEMNMPGFDAESSLGPAISMYRGKAIFDRSVTAEVLPVQDFLASPPLSQTLASPFLRSTIGRTITCCLVGRHPPCVTYVVPFFENCECQFGAPVCTPFVNQAFNLAP
jgi:hypothetical protein